MRSIRNVLIVHPYGIGDLLFMTPVLRALRLVPSVERIDMLLGSRTEAVVRDNPHIDEIFELDKDFLRSLKRLDRYRLFWTLVQKLKKRNYDLLLDYSMRAEWGFISQYYFRIPRRAGFNYKNRGFFHNFRLQTPQGFEARHAADFYCDLAEEAGIEVEDRHFEFYLNQDARFEAKKILDRHQLPADSFLVLSPGGGASWGKDAHFKQWPPQFFANLTNRLSEKIPIKSAIVIGSKNESDLGEIVCQRLAVSGINLCGKIELKVAAALIQQSAAVLTNDGGILHLSHALRKPLVALFGPVDPRVYGPYPKSNRALCIYDEDLSCRPCYQRFRYKQDCSHQNCLKALSPEEVFFKIESTGWLSQLSNSFLNSQRIMK